jgi:predicted amidophosphoribosyltransferase
MEEQNFQSRYEKKQNNLGQNICPSCSTNLDLSDSFCPECGTKVNNEVTVCRICGSVCDGIFCDNCGASQVSKQCGKCNTVTLGDFCEVCGEPLTEIALQFLENRETEGEMEVLSPKEAEEILKDMESLLNPEVKRMQEKMRQRIILEREREYFNQREEKIQAYQSGNRPKIKGIEPEDLKKIQNQMKNFSGFLDRQIQQKQEEEKELVRQKKEEQIRIAEEKRLKKANRVNGLWVSTLGDSIITLDLR